MGILDDVHHLLGDGGRGGTGLGSGSGGRHDCVPDRGKCIDSGEESENAKQFGGTN